MHASSWFARFSPKSLGIGAVGLALVLSLGLFINSVKAGTGLSVTPNFPTPVTVGQTGVAASLVVANASTVDEGNVTVSNITLIPSCGNSTLECTAPDPDVFALSATGTGAAGTSCAGDTFTITEIDATTGKVSFTRNGGPLVLAFNASCTIDFTIDVLKSPTVDSSANAGIQTNQRGAATGLSALNNPAEGTGADTTTVQTSNIIVDKVTNPSGSSQSFSFDAGGGTYADFSLTDAAAPNNQTLAPGTYSVSETVPAGWTQTSAICVSSIQDTETIGTLELDAGETITCTFTNTQDSHIIVIKDSQPNSAQDFTFTNNFDNGNPATFDLDDDADGTLLNSRDSVVTPGTYSVSEGAVAGWTNTSATCDMGETVDSIDVAAGETVTCTFVNTQESRIIVDKVTDPAGHAQSFSFDASGGSYADFSLTDAAAPNSQVLTPGAYSVAETLPAGWDLTSSTCVSSLQDTETPASIELDAGETVTCTFTNTQQDSHIIVIKDAQPDSAQDFTFTNNFGNGNPATFDLDDDADGTLLSSRDSVVTPGTYSVSEGAVAGWTQTSATCDMGETIDSIDVAAGETVTCTFVNTQIVAEGCTPGFWKQTQHFAAWVDFDPDDEFFDVFGVHITVGAGGKKTITDPTLLEALNATGGGMSALARHTVAALLNSTNSDVEFPFTEAEVIQMFQDAVDSGDLSSLQSTFATANEAGCPIDGQSAPVTISQTQGQNQDIVVIELASAIEPEVVVVSSPDNTEVKGNNGKALGKNK